MNEQYQPDRPEQRSRRLRRTPALRRLVAQARLSVDDLVAPLFVKEGIDAPEPVPSMPGVERLSIDLVVDDASHFYDPTRASFEAIFERGGIPVHGGEVAPDGIGHAVDGLAADGRLLSVAELAERTAGSVEPFDHR